MAVVETKDFILITHQRASSVSIGLFGHKVIQVGADGHLYTQCVSFPGEKLKFAEL